MKDKQYKQKISPEKCNTETKTPTYPGLLYRALNNSARNNSSSSVFFGDGFRLLFLIL